MKRAVVLGGGFGGIAAATRLRELSPDAEVVLIAASATFAMGFHKVSWIVGREKPGDGARPLSALAERGIDVRQATVEGIDPAARTVTAGGQTLEADAIVFALGADVDDSAVPGLAAQDNAYSIYTFDGAARAAEAFAAMQRGTLVVGIFGAPYKCPPAPFELALLAQDAIGEARKNVAITLFSPLPMSLPVLGPQGCNPLEARIAMQGIDFRPNVTAERVEAGRVVLAGGGDIAFDTLFAVAPHTVPAVAVEAGLAKPGGWVKVNPRTLATPFEGVYAAGDATGIPLSNGQGLPKAGEMAAKHGVVAAERIAATFAGAEPEATFDGTGACFLEVGGGEAMLVDGRFLDDPPVVELTQPSADQLAQKDVWERERLEAWFGK